MKSFFYSFVLLSALFLTGCTHADAGKDQTVYSGDTVTLDAGNSTGDSDELRYHWTQVKGIPIQLSGEDNVRATFIAPNVKKRKRLLFKLTVIEEHSHAISQDYVTIIVKPRVTLPRDVTAPSITLNGETTLTLTVGDTYTESGATATDDRDGSVDVTISGSVDTTKAGDYTVIYTASDKTGNTATATRIINVILPPDTNSTLILHGTISDRLENPLYGVKVFSGNKFTFTDKNGTYELPILRNTTTTITTKHNKYIQNSHTILVSEDKKSSLDMTLTTYDIIKTFNVSNNITINIKGATVSFNPLSIVYLDGSLYEGNVTIKGYFNHVSSYIGRRIFPGEYIGINNKGEKTVIDSYGFIDIVLEDPQGKLLRIADGENAIVSFPHSQPKTIQPQETIPLWYYDIDKGLWIEDGFVTYDTNSSTYITKVSHFTTWNYGNNYFDTKASLSCCVKNSDGTNATNVQLLIKDQKSYSYAKMQDLSDEGGSYTVYNVPGNGVYPFTLTAFGNGKISSPIEFSVSHPGEKIIMKSCLVLNKDISTQIITLKASGVPYPEGREFIKNTKKEEIAFTIAKAGNIEVAFPRPYDNKVLLFDNENLQSNGIIYSLDPYSTVTNLGNLGFSN